MRALPLFVVLSLVRTVAAGAEPSATDDIAAALAPLVATYCVDCHADDDGSGGVNLGGRIDELAIVHDRKLWARVLEQIETEEMPTEEPLPSPIERAAMVTTLRTALDAIDWSAHADPGHETIPRLTTIEYRNTLRDLLGVEVPTGIDFTEDGEGASGFDNDRDSLFLTLGQMEKYLASAEIAVAAVTAHRNVGQMLSKRLEAESMFMTETKTKTVSFDDGSVGYSLNRGQMTLYDSVSFPADGFYRFTVRARTTGGPTMARLRIDDVVAADVPVASPVLDDGSVVAFVRGGQRQMAWNLQKPPFAKSDEAPEATDEPVYEPLPKDASRIISTKGVTNAPAIPPSLLKPSDKAHRELARRFDREASSVQRAYEWLRLHGPDGDPAQIQRFRRYVAERTKAFDRVFADAPSALGLAPETFETAYRQHNAATLADRTDLLRAATTVLKAQVNPNAPPGNVSIDRIDVTGPVTPPWQGDAGDRVFIVEPGTLDASGMPLSESDAARVILRRFLSRAFRRPVTEDEVARYVAIYEAERRGGVTHDDAIGLSLTAALVSPNFLYRDEINPAAEAAYRLSDYQLASRLSYFLWMTMPDDRLFELAAGGRLHEPDVLRAEVRRMLADERADAFARQFTGQWLGFGPHGERIVPDAFAFRRDFNDELRDAMVAETVLTFDAILRGNRSLIELLDHDETYLNGPLAKHYDIDGVTGLAMRRVSLPDRRRGGLLGMASVLAATSTPRRTSPVIRGAWLLETLLAEEIPPPPENAGELPANAGQVKGRQTLRQELQRHRDQPACAGCHAKIDPLGFGLENWDAIGRWRDATPAGPVDASGTLPDGTRFDGVVELKDYLVRHRRDDFIRGVSEKMLSFALGRRLHYYDQAAVDRIVDRLEAGGFGARLLLEEVVLSEPFGFQTNAPKPADP